MQTHNRDWEEWTKGISSIAQVREWPAYSQKPEESPKAKESNELGFELSLLKYCDAWLTQGHVAK